MELKLFFILVIFTDNSHQQFYGMTWPLRQGSRQVTNALANKISLEVFKYKPDKNQVVSPLAMKFPLCKLADISVGEAKRELLSALGLNRDFMAQNCYREVKKSLAIVKESDLILLNKIYINENSNISAAFKINLTEIYGVQLEPIGFKYPKAALRHMNSWFENLTFKRIQDILLPYEINKDTSMAIVNAAHFKGTWENQFNLKDSKMGKFHRIDHSVVMVPMMNKYDTLLYNDMGSFRTITTFMMNWGSTMTFVLPSTPEGIRELLTKLEMDPELIRNAKRNSKHTLIKLQMPRIKIKSEIDFNKHLKEIGIKKIFNATDSGLKNMTHPNSTENIYLSKAKQKIFIDLDEFGVFRSPRSQADYIEEIIHYGKYANLPRGPGKHTDFKLDKPFLFTVNVLGGDVGSQGPDGQGKGNPSEGPLVNTYELFVGVYYGPEE